MPSKKVAKLQDRLTSAGQDIAASARKVEHTAPSGKKAKPAPSSPVPISLPIDKIVPNPEQPRTNINEEELKELAETIKDVGILQPVLVTPGADGIYTLVAGHRRWYAARLAGATEILAVVSTSDDLGKLALIENLQRSDLGPIEEATALHSLKEKHGYTQERLASELGKKRTWVAESLGLLRLPESIKREVGTLPVSKSLLIEISRLKTEEEMLAAWESLNNSSATVANARAIVADTQTQRRPRSSQLDKFSSETLRYQERVSRLLGRKLEDSQIAMIRGELETLRSYIEDQLGKLK